LEGWQVEVGKVNTKPLDNHHRRSIRLHGYDYTRAGAYFVTIVTHQRDCLLGEIRNGEMVLNHFGQIADECWRAIPEHFPFVELGAFVVMPNHVHGIVVITATDVGAQQCCAPTCAPTITDPHKINVKPGSLGAIVRSFKSAVSYRINKEHNTTGIWQRNYYEHIIRNEKDLQRITDYIQANPLRWDEDNENPVRATHAPPLQPIGGNHGT
jgi:REP element-mobilizing transposase RayT